MEHCRLIFLLLCPLSNLFYCHRLVLLYLKHPNMSFFNDINILSLLPHFNTIINLLFHFFILTSIFLNSGFSELRRIQSGKDAQILTFDVNTGVLNIKTKMTPPISTPPIDENGEAANGVVPLVAVSTIESSSVTCQNRLM